MAADSGSVPPVRFGIYKLVRRRIGRLLDERVAAPRRIGPHVFRHTTAVHLLEAGVEVNAIRGWLGHVDLATTNRYADIKVRTNEARSPPVRATAGRRRREVTCTCVGRRRGNARLARVPLGPARA
jgi:integrase